MRERSSRSPYLSRVWTEGGKNIKKLGWVTILNNLSCVHEEFRPWVHYPRIVPKGAGSPHNWIDHLILLYCAGHYHIIGSLHSITRTFLCSRQRQEPCDVLKWQKKKWNEKEISPSSFFGVPCSIRYTEKKEHNKRKKRRFNSQPNKERENREREMGSVVERYKTLYTHTHKKKI